MDVGMYRAVVAAAAIVAAVVLVATLAGPPQYAFAEMAPTPINLTMAGRISDDDSLNLYAINDIATFESAGRAYVAVVSGEGMQVLDLTDPHRIYVAVTAYWEDGVQVLDLTDPYNIVPADGIGDDDNTVLDGARYIAAFESAGRTYAAVTSNEGVQVLDLTDPHNIIPAGHITNGNSRYLSGIEDIAIFESAGRTYAAVALYDDIQIIQLTDDVDRAAHGNGQDNTPVNLVVTTHSPGCTAIFLLEYDVTRKTELRPTHLYSLEEVENGLNMTFGTHAAVASKLVPLLADRGEISSVASYSAGPSPVLLAHDTNPDIDTNPFTGTINLCDVLREPLLGAAVDALLADSGPTVASGSTPYRNLVPITLDTDNFAETLTYLKEGGAVIHLVLEDTDGGGSIEASVPLPLLLFLYGLDHVTDLRELMPEYMHTGEYGSIDTELHSINGPEVTPEPELEIILQNDTTRDRSATIAPPEPVGGSGTPYFGHEGMLYVLAAVGAVFGSVAAVFLVRARSGKYKASGVPAIRVVRP